MENLLIDVGKQFDGYTFSLNPLTKRELDKIFSSPRPAGSVFVSADTLTSFQVQFGPVIKYILLTILGVPAAQFDKVRHMFGQVVFRNPANNQLLYDLPLRDVHPE